MPKKTETRKVKCEGRELTYTLMRKPVKNVNLRIKPDGSIVVSANPKVPVTFVEDFIKEKQKYIIAALDKYLEKRKPEEEFSRQYASGENYSILGKNLQLKVEEARQEEVFADGAYIYLRVKNADNFRHKEIMMDRWQKEYQKKIFGEVCDEIYQIFKKYGVSYPEVKIRAMTSRWGSCQPQKGKITLNSKLIEAPRDCIEYVVLHEFAHFIHPNHSRQFWDFVAMLMPDWKERRKELNKIM